MKNDPYENRLLDHAMPCTAKNPVLGQVSAVLHARAENRGLVLEPFPSRAVLKHEIHELILTEETASPGSKVDRIAYVCFFEVTDSGVLWQGDSLVVNGHKIGMLTGYEFSHMPNHMNIIVKAAEQALTGFELNLNPGDPIEFRFEQYLKN